jgi:hypothetical protein
MWFTRVSRSSSFRCAHLPPLSALVLDPSHDNIYSFPKVVLLCIIALGKLRICGLQDVKLLAILFCHWIRVFQEELKYQCIYSDLFPVMN